MRAGPIGLLFYDDPQQLIQASHDQGRITHQDRRCTAGAIAIVGAVGLVIGDESLELSTFTSKLSDWVRPFDVNLADGLRRMPDWVQLSPDHAVTPISRVGLAPEYVDEWEGISPFVTGSVLWSLYSFLRAPDDYWEAIGIAIAVGGDVDTTAAMTGAISGASVGMEGLPSSQAELLNDRGTWMQNDLMDLARESHLLKTRT